MAAIANIVVKKTDNVTDVTYTAIAGAATDGASATWQNTAGSTVRAYRPSLAMSAKLNGTKQARRVDVKFMYPVVRVISSVDTLIGKIPVDFSVPVPEWATDAEVNEAVDQAINLLASAHVRTHVKSGFAPN